MTLNPEFNTTAQMSIQEIRDVTSPLLDAKKPLIKMINIDAIANQPVDGWKVEAGSIVREGDEPLLIPTKDAIDSEQARLTGFEDEIRNRLGIADGINIDEVWHVAITLAHDIEIPWASDLRSVTDFLRAIHAVSKLTGDSYLVWINKYRMEQENIDAATDIDDLIARAKQLDIEGCQMVLSRTGLSDEEKSNHSLDKVENWFKSDTDYLSMLDRVSTSYESK